MLLIMTFLCFSLSFLFMMMKHPLSMGFMLLIQTFYVCLLTGIFTKTFWFSYVLFLIFMGGMLVLFIYVTSLSSNEIFTFSFKLMIFFMSLMFIFSCITFIMDNSLISPIFNNLEMTSMLNFHSFSLENMISLKKLYNFPTNLITILLINYLFLTLLVTVKITKKNYGPLRPMN